MKISFHTMGPVTIICALLSFPFLAVAVTYSTRPPQTGYRGGTPVTTYPASTIAFPQLGDNVIQRPSVGE